MHTSITRTLSIGQTILAILFDVGGGTLKSFFPHPYSHIFCKHKNKTSFRPALYRLRTQGLIELATNDGNDIFRLTKKGEHEALLAHINAEAIRYRIPRQRWDGKWRIIFFDIPEKQRHKRDYLRSLLKPLGFKEFQKSIWVSPHKIPNFFIRMLKDESIVGYTRFITTQNIDYDKDLRSKFKLS